MCRQKRKFPVWPRKKIKFMGDTKLIQELRERTGCGIMDCKEALSEANDDFDKAIEILRKKGMKMAAKKAGREAGEGIIEAYIHPGAKIGAMVYLACETDFVARNGEFKQLAHDIAMQIAALQPLYVSFEDIPKDILEKEREIARETAKAEGKPENIIEKIVEGRIQKFAEDVCLLNQLFFKDDKKTIGDLIGEAVAKLGENIQVKKFTRFAL